MKQLTPTHHRNYLEVEHKSTGRGTPFAPRHHGELFSNPYTYQRKKVIYFSLQSQVLVWVFCFRIARKAKIPYGEPVCRLYLLRNRKHVPCFYQVIQTRVEVWENEKCGGNTSCRQVFPQLFRVLPNFHKCLYNSIETWSTCFLFLLENNVTRKRKTTC